MKDKIIKYSISMIFLLLPIIDILRITYLKDVEILNISIIELVNILLISIAFIMTIIKTNIKFKRNIFIYITILITYLILHCIHIYNFDTNIYEKASPNFFVELYYIFRVYILPLLLIIVLCRNKDIFNKKYYLGITKYLICFISGTIFLTNMFRFSFSSYSSSSINYLINNTNFFDVFKYKDNFRTLLTCGLFPSANQISIILVMLLPINIYNLYTNRKITDVLLVILQTFSMIIVGTKVAALGSIIILVCTLLLYLFFVLFFKKKTNKKYLIMHIICIIFATAIILISPFKEMMIHKVSFSSGITSATVENTEDEMLIYAGLDNEMTDQEFVKYLTENNVTFKISNVFYKMYPIEKDRSFWLKMAKRDKKLNNDYRIIKDDIINRIFVRNNNKYDKFFGLGYTLNFLDIERDYVYQYYLFGLFGFFLLVGTYVLLYIYNVVNAFNKKNFRYSYCLCLVSSLFGLVLSYFSGHLFGWVSPMIILALTLSVERNEDQRNES